MKEKVLDNKKNGMGMMVLFILLYAVAAAAVVKQEGKPNNIRRSLRTDSPYGHRYHLGFTWMDPVPWP